MCSIGPDSRIAEYAFIYHPWAAVTWACWWVIWYPRRQAAITQNVFYHLSKPQSKMYCFFQVGCSLSLWHIINYNSDQKTYDFLKCIDQRFGNTISHEVRDVGPTLRTVTALSLEDNWDAQFQILWGHYFVELLV